MKKVAIFILIIALLSVVLGGCTYRAENYVFGTYYSIKIDGKNANKIGQLANETLLEIDNILSTNIIDSDVSKINNSPAKQKIKVSAITADIFKIAKELYLKTGKTFNPASFPLTELWKFSPSTYTGVEHSIPSQSEIEAILPYCNMNMFELDESNLTIAKNHPSAKLDFGGIAKGYAADVIYEKAKSQEKLVLDIGRTFKVKGEVSLYVANPREGDFVAKATIDGCAVATSGDYERYYIIEGKRYHHIIAPDGYPSGISELSPIISATIVGESATICDALSTATMILGYESSKPIIEEYGYSALLLTETGYYTIGENIFEIQDQTRQKLN